MLITSLTNKDPEAQKDLPPIRVRDKTQFTSELTILSAPVISSLHIPNPTRLKIHFYPYA